MIDTKLDYRYANKNEIKEKFSLKYLDSINDLDIQNIKTKSMILAPFCSSFKSLSTTNNMIKKDKKNRSINNHFTNTSNSINKELVIDNNLIKFEKNVIDLNKNYERNNNGELDNGIFIKQNEEKIGDKKGSQKHSKKNSGSITPNIEKVFIKDITNIMNPSNQNSLFNSITSLSLKIDNKVVKLVCLLGYKKEDIVKALKQNECSYMTTAYYLLCKV